MFSYMTVLHDCIAPTVAGTPGNPGKTNQF